MTKQSGLSLIEIMVVLAILVILAVVAIPAVGIYISKDKDVPVVEQSESSILDAYDLEIICLDGWEYYANNNYCRRILEPRLNAAHEQSACKTKRE